MNSRNIETAISLDNIKAQVETFLRINRYVNESEDVNIVFKDTILGTDGKRVVPMNLTIYPKED